MTQARVDNARDVVAFLTAQHERIKELFDAVTNQSGSQREGAFLELRRLLAVHETAEEEIVHPRARTALSDGERIIDTRLEEENEAKEVLTELEQLDVDSAEFVTKFGQLKQDVLAHASAEETQEFDRLAIELDTAELERMRNAVKVAQAIAPTRPHPGVESASANMIAGPFAAMIDRARDAIMGRG